MIQARQTPDDVVGGRFRKHSIHTRSGFMSAARLAQANLQSLPGGFSVREPAGLSDLKLERRKLLFGEVFVLHRTLKALLDCLNAKLGWSL